MSTSRRACLSAAAFSGLALCLGCHLMSSQSSPRVVPAASTEDKAALFEPLQQLDGEWVMTDEKGQATVASVFKTTSAGSAVREVMFPGSPQEMTNMYHLDGRDLVVTHYCAEGNQPRMRAKPGKPGVLAFAFDSVTNLSDPHEQVMGELTLTIVDKDTIQEDWRSLKDGKLTEHARFELKRKK